jgi:hypothetical protein
VGQKRNADSVLLGKPAGNRHGRPQHRWDNINIDINEI